MVLPALVAAWLLAFAAVGAWHAPWWLTGLGVAMAAPVGALKGRKAAALMAVAAIVALAGGFEYHEWLERRPPLLAAAIPGELVLQGTIDSDPDPGETTVRYVVNVERVSAGLGRMTPTDGRVLVTLQQYARFLPGDSVLLEGEFERPPVFEGFDYRAYLARRDIVATAFFPRVTVLDGDPGPGVERLGAQWRRRLEEGLQRSLPEPESSLASGIAFGRDGNMPDVLVDDFRDAGLAHLVAVSGSNVVLVVALVFIVATRLVRRTLAIVPAAATVALYVAVAGFSGSVVRAAIMAGVFLVGSLIGRPQSGLAALAMASFLMTAIQPATAVDVGFQLSVAATAGLIVLAPWITAGLDWCLVRAPGGAAVPRWVVQVMALTLSASIATIPITAATFERLSLVGPVANLVAEPAFAVAFWLSLVAALAEVVWSPLGWAVGLAAYYPLAFISVVAKTAASVPGAAIDTPGLDPADAAVWLLGFAVAGWALNRRYAPVVARPEPGPGAVIARRILLAGLAGALLAIAVRESILPIGGPGELEVSVLDVGQGDAILVRTPGGHSLLVDGGPSAVQLARELSAVLPHWQRNLDEVVLTHPQEDHIAGLVGAFDRYDVARAADSGAANTTVAYGLYGLRSGRQVLLAAGDAWSVDGVSFDVLWPPRGLRTDNLNDTSIVLRISYGSIRILLTGDIEAGPQAALMVGEVAAADVLKVPHHGSASSDPTFLRAVGAKVAVISVGAGNRFGHPSDETLEALVGTRLLRTDQDGRVTIRSDGKSIRVSTSR